MRTDVKIALKSAINCKVVILLMLPNYVLYHLLLPNNKHSPRTTYEG